jgi:hypothetical protein|uniref:EGF-like domain-containing protein n=1 Tax=Globisporangium ultimum (strain ATCC 200006 / CBS 805.95 / DAOM BR144) TaxID=431595 RepID=K3WKA1_GLOUD
MLSTRSLTILAAALLSALVASPTTVQAAVTVPEYYCETDAECAEKFSDTVCISVDNYGDVVKKCTPNTKSRPACRGGQPGLCPSYQSAEVSYLNAHCVFVAKDNLESSSSASGSSASGSGSARRERFLLSEEEMASLASSGSGSSASTTAVGDSAASGSAAKGENKGTYAIVTIANKTVTGQFVCMDVSDCENKAADTSTCDVVTCGSPGSKTQCNNHGTCTYKSIQTMSKRSCMCYKGFQGDKCQQEVSSECDVDCGMGGDCVDGECVCKKGWDGKPYKGKQGKASQRCTKCTNDQACQNGNPCDTETGVCVCNAGYFGQTCGATEDSCTNKNCYTGNCQVLANGSSACFCPLCSPDCTMCPTKDCSTCPSGATSTEISKLAVFVSAIFALFIANFTL